VHRNRDHFRRFAQRTSANRRVVLEELASDDGDDADDDDTDDQQKCTDNDHRRDYRLGVGSVVDAAA